MTRKRKHRPAQGIDSGTNSMTQVGAAHASKTDPTLTSGDATSASVLVKASKKRPPIVGTDEASKRKKAKNNKKKKSKSLTPGANQSQPPRDIHIPQLVRTFGSTQLISRPVTASPSTITTLRTTQLPQQLIRPWQINVTITPGHNQALQMEGINISIPTSSRSDTIALTGLSASRRKRLRRKLRRLDRQGLGTNTQKLDPKIQNESRNAPDPLINKPPVTREMHMPPNRQKQTSATMRRESLFKPLGGGRAGPISFRSDAPDTLAQWNRSVRAAEGSDSDESSSDGDGDDESVKVNKSSMRGSFHESWADQISGRRPVSTALQDAHEQSSRVLPGNLAKSDPTANQTSVKARAGPSHSEESDSDGLDCTSEKLDAVRVIDLGDATEDDDEDRQKLPRFGNAQSARLAQEVEDDLYAAVDEATTLMMGEHSQALHECKTLPHPIPLTEDRKDHSLTNSDSDHQAQAVDSSITGKTSDHTLKLKTQEVSGEKMDRPSEQEAERSAGQESSPGEGSEGTNLKASQSSGHSSSQLSELSKTPSRPEDMLFDHPIVLIPRVRTEDILNASSGVSTKKRKMTGASSKHFSQAKKSRRPKDKNDQVATADARRSDAEDHPRDFEENTSVDDGLFQTRGSTKSPGDCKGEDQPQPSTPANHLARATRTPTTKGMPRSQRKSTGTISTHFIESRVDIYNTTNSGRKVPAGTSVVPAPSIQCDTFGIIQEKYWDQPFWLLVAVALLNKTTGRAAVPVFKKVMQRYSTPEQLAAAKNEDVLDLIQNLGLQNNRTKSLIRMAQQWIETPPVAARLYRKRDYPDKGHGKASEVANIAEEDTEICKGAIEIGHLFGCGAYAFDSWRIFCRDVLRGVADDYQGKNANSEDFEPEWKRVVPGDKELRACLRWMWLREGWIWDPLTGHKRRATDDEMERAIKGEMAIDDTQERKFAAQAAGADFSPAKQGVGAFMSTQEETPSKNKASRKMDKRAVASTLVLLEEDEDYEEVIMAGDEENIPGLLPNDGHDNASSNPRVEASSTRRRTPSRFAKAVESIEKKDHSEPSRCSSGSTSKRTSSDGSRSVTSIRQSKTPGTKKSRHADEDATTQASPKRDRKGRFSKTVA